MIVTKNEPFSKEVDNRRIIFSSLALDLRRAAQGYFRGSNKMADRFFEEALKRRDEAASLEMKPYLANLLNKIEDIKLETDSKRRAESALMYSTLFQNAALL